MNMKSLFKLTLTFLVFAVLTFSCQDEEVIIENPSEEEVIQPGSSLSNLMRMTVTNDGAQDNLLDNSSCTEIVLPVTITISETTITINSLDDLWMVAELLNNPAGNDGIEFTFPITVTFGNYTQIVIENQDQLNSIVEECLTEPEVIECVDFVYPISFSIYNTDFQVIDTVQINSDEELYVFLDDLDAANEGAVLASLNFPVTLVYANGNTQEVNSNQELETAINQAETDCNNEGCQEEQVGYYLTDCFWTITSVGDEVGTLSNYYLYFNEDGTVTVHDGFTTVALPGLNWQVEGTTTGVYLFMSDADTYLDAVNGDWLVTSCGAEMLVLQKDTDAEVVELVLEKNCTTDESPFSCFSNTTVTACDYDADGVTTFELETLVLGNVLCDYDFTPSFHVSHADAEAAMNALPFPNSYQNTSNPETIYLRIESNSGAFQVFEINLVVEPCATDCSEMDVDGFLQTCAWNIVNYNGSNDLIDFEFNFDDNQVLTVTGMGATYTGGWSTSQSANGGVEVVFDNVAGPSIQAINGSWIVIDCQPHRLEMVMGDNHMVMEQQNCYSSDELYTIATECRWEVYSYINDQGSDVTSDYDGILYSFFENGFVVAENGITIGYGGLTAENTATEQLVVLLHLYNSVSGIGNYYTVESLSSEEIVLSSFGDAELIFHRTCNSTNQDGDTAQIKTWLYEGNWEITYSSMDSADNTSDYANVTFDFQQGTNLIGSDGSSTANMHYEVLRDEAGNLRMVIDYLGIFPYWQMDDDWYITEVNNQRIELHYINDDANDESVIVFEKI